jgi:hypothetical protein
MVTISPRKRKTTQSLFAGFLILSMLAGVLSACTMSFATPPPTSGTAAALLPSQDPLATLETTLVTPTELATEIPTVTLTPEPTATATIEPTATATEVPTQTAAEFPAEVQILSSEELAEKKLYGSGFEMKTDFQGIPVDLTIVTSKAILEQYKQTRGCMPNQEMVKYGASAENRIAEMVFRGHYVGYLRYRDILETNYAFEQYIVDLKTGADRSYTTWGPRLDGSTGEFRVNPLAPVEYVTTNEKVDPDGNGRTTTSGGDSNGFQQLENGGLRFVKAIGIVENNYNYFCLSSTNSFSSSLLLLGHSLETLEGKWQVSFGDKYPVSKAKLFLDLPKDLSIYNNSNDLNDALWILIAP